MKPSADESAKPKLGRKGWLFVFGLTLLTGAALLVNHAARDGQTMRSPDADYGAVGGAARPGDSQLRPGDAYAGGPIAPLEGDPGGMTPPRGAQRAIAQTYQMGRNVESRAMYACPGLTVEQIVSHYRTLLGERGYRPRIAATSQPSGSILIYDSPDGSVILHVKKPSLVRKHPRVILTHIDRSQSR